MEPVPDADLACDVHFDHEASAPEGGPVSAQSPRWFRPLRWAVNAWLVFHLGAMVIAPAAFGPSSELVQSAWDLFQPYIQVLYLNHAYHFFAPEPEESTLLVYEAERPDGTVVRGRLPDPSIAPRLLYHRYFMLTEHMKEAREEVRELWHRSYAEQIGRETGASVVRLTKQTHLLSTMQRVREGGALDDPESYENEPLGEFPCDGL